MPANTGGSNTSFYTMPANTGGSNTSFSSLAPDAAVATNTKTWETSTRNQMMNDLVFCGSQSRPRHISDGKSGVLLVRVTTVNTINKTLQYCYYIKGLKQSLPSDG